MVQIGVLYLEGSGFRAMIMSHDVSPGRLAAVALNALGM